MNKTITEQYDWDELIDYISEKNLTPVIGKEMYKYREGDRLQPIDSFFSKRLLEIYKITDYNAASLTDAVNILEFEKKIKPIDIIRRLKSIAKEINFDFPLLSGFLKITGLKYYINTAVYNNVLENKLAEIQRVNASSINFSINEPFSDSDDLEKLKEPFVFNVFGSLLNTVDPALSEDDMLEFAGYYREKMNSASNIVNALKNKNLLFLGCAFPDWMIRFALRLLSNEPMHEWGSKRSIIVVNDRSDFRDKQYEILKRYEVVTYDGDTENFVQELLSQWKQRNPNAGKTKTVFLSYTIKDKTAVENLKKAIESLGNVSCWYDNHEIMPGDDFKTAIAKNIKSADLFIPLISQNSLMHKDGYVQLEWFTADNVNTFRKIDGNSSKYLMPVVIDDSNPYDSNVPKYFSELSIGKVPGGIPDAEFLKQLKETLNNS
jgi:hypothetical protein